MYNIIYNYLHIIFVIISFKIVETFGNIIKIKSFDYNIYYLKKKVDNNLKLMNWNLIFKKNSQTPIKNYMYLQYLVGSLVGITTCCIERIANDT